MHLRLRQDFLLQGAPQWATVGSLQGKLGVPEPQFMFKAHAYCNQMGLREMAELYSAATG